LILYRFQQKFLRLKSKGINLEQFLDIGAYHGDFTETVRSVWTYAKVQQFEANENNKPFLQLDAKFTLLGDTDREVNFYTIDGVTTGSSIYKELTSYYKDPIVLKKQMTTLDKVVDDSGNWNLGMIKIDTQGSELDVLRGASNFVKNKKPKYILLECSFKQYNEGAPLFAEVVNFMDAIDYKVEDIIELTYDSSQELLQANVVFELRD
jgi:FkbM family methyltransferase